MNKNHVGGNTFLVYFGSFLLNIGKFFTEKGEKIIYNGKPRIISNPIASWINPFTIIYSFTIDNTQKYQLIMENEMYKDRYKEDNQNINLTEEQLYDVIRNNRKKWFLKQ